MPSLQNLGPLEQALAQLSRIADAFDRIANAVEVFVAAHTEDDEDMIPEIVEVHDAPKAD